MLARSSCGALSSSSFSGLALTVPFVLGYRLSRGDRATTPVAMSGVVDEVRAALTDQYYRPVPASVLQLGSVDRMISALGDPYTAYLAPIDYSLLRQQTESRYSGIGVSVLPSARGLVVVSLRPGPAERAGVRAGDTIVSIDGVAARHLDASSARARMFGPTGSQVQLALVRAHKRVDVKVRREMVQAPIVRVVAPLV